MSTYPIRLAVLSRQEVVARGLAAMLSDYPHRVVVAAVGNGHAQIPDVEVVLYDALGLHNNDGSELERLIKETSAKVLLYSRDMRPDLRARARDTGVAGWISMSTRAKELVEAIELVLEGLPLPDNDDEPGHTVGLSPREAATLALIAQGRTNEQIAEHLAMSANTLKGHIRHCYRKIGVSSRAQAVAWAIAHGFTPTHDRD